MAGQLHRDLPLQYITTADGRSKHAIALHIEELLASGIERIALVVQPNSPTLLSELIAQFPSAIELIIQEKPLGFGHAVLCAEKFVNGDPFLLQVCDHVFITFGEKSCTTQLIEVASRENCPVSGVQATSEHQLSSFGVIGGRRLKGEEHVFAIDRVLEKPTPTVAEACCMIPGLRLGTYFGFFGAHALTSDVFDRLREIQSGLGKEEKLGLSEALDKLAARQRYLALQVHGHRVDLEGPFGILRAQMAVALHGARRHEVLEVILEEMAAVIKREA
jgi:UTP--glucose-1-phosphate uridylyltransferase